MDGDDIVLIPLYHRTSTTIIGWTVIDAIDYPVVSKIRWHQFKVRQYTYVTSRTNGQTVWLHRFICGLGKGREPQVDHYNHDTLDNRRDNLRICSQGQNLQNRFVNSNSNTLIRSVHKSGLKWRVRVKLNGKRQDIGSFDTLEEAEIMARSWRMLNMPFATF